MNGYLPSIIARLVVFSLAEVHIERSSIVLKQFPVTFSKLEETGLIQLNDAKTYGRFVVGFPILALSVMNEFMEHQLPDTIVHPFTTGFMSVEQLALGSLYYHYLAARYLSLESDTEVLCDLSSLRPGARVVGDASMLKLQTSELVGFVQTGTKISSTSSSVNQEFQLGSDQKGGVILPKPGLFMMSAANQQGVDGVVVLSGKFKGKDAVILILSQSKSLEMSSNVHENPVTTGHVNSCIQKMKEMESAYIQAWLKNHHPEKKVVVIYDIFTNKVLGEQFKEPDALPDDAQVASRIIMITSRNEMTQVVGRLVASRMGLTVGEQKKAT